MFNIKEIDVHTLKNKLDQKDDFILIDVREKNEIEICKINESIHIPMQSIPAHIKEIDNQKTIIIMCKSGVRSAQVCNYLNDSGYLNIYNLKGGIINWALEIDSNMEIY
jgi:rhodanese-related sulfurtransferase